MEIKQKVKEFIKTVPRPLWTAIGVWVFVISAVCAWKYWTFQYRDLDLAYFAQALWNTAHFRLFYFTIHPTLTLGDHAEWLLLPIAVIFRLLPHPVTLLTLQAASLASGAVPLYLIAKRKLPAKWALGVGIAYLFLAVPANAALFEFHALAFALPFLLWTAEAYDRKDLRTFLIFLGLSLLVREDVALATIGFAAIAALERRDKRWIAWPLALSAGVLALDWLTISHFAINGSYKFGVYYGWLNKATAFSLFRHFSSIPVIEFLLGMLMPFLVLPILRPKWLLVAVLPAIGIIMQSSGGGALALEMHYAVLVLPGLLLASLAGLETLLNGKTRIFPWAPLRGTDSLVLAFVLAIAVAAQTVTLGPLSGILAGAFRPLNTDASAAKELMRQIPPYASVAASDSLLPHLADRPTLYALKYLLLGVTQYSAATYDPRPLPDYLAIDAHEALVDAVQFPSLGWTETRYAGIPKRLRAILAEGGYGPVWSKGGYTLWQKGVGTGSISSALVGGDTASAPVQVGSAKVYGLRADKDCPSGGLCLTLSMSLDKDPGEDLVVSLDFKDKDGRTISNETRLLGDLLLPTHEWSVGEIKGVKFDVLGDGLSGAASAEIKIFRPRGALVMGPLRSSMLLLLRPAEAGTVVEVRR